MEKIATRNRTVADFYRQGMMRMAMFSFGYRYTAVQLLKFPSSDPLTWSDPGEVLCIEVWSYKNTENLVLMCNAYNNLLINQSSYQLK